MARARKPPEENGEKAATSKKTARVEAVVVGGASVAWMEPDAARASYLLPGDEGYPEVELPAAEYERLEGLGYVKKKGDKEEKSLEVVARIPDMDVAELQEHAEGEDETVAAAARNQLDQLPSTA